MADEQRRAIHLTDPSAMRALSHPTRLRLLAELRMRGAQSVWMLCEVVDEPAGSVSYHLGKLAAHGFVEEAPEHARSRRERWWRAAHERTTWEPLEVLEDPERRAALDSLRRTILQRYQDNLLAYLESEPSLEPEWVGSGASGDTVLHLTADELAELREELDAFAMRWGARSDPARSESRAVSFIYHAFRRPR